MLLRCLMALAPFLFSASPPSISFFVDQIWRFSPNRQEVSSLVRTLVVWIYYFSAGLSVSLLFHRSRLYDAKLYNSLKTTRRLPSIFSPSRPSSFGFFPPFSPLPSLFFDSRRPPPCRFITQSAFEKNYKPLPLIPPCSYKPWLSSPSPPRFLFLPAGPC